MTTTLIPHLHGERRKGTWWRNRGQTFWGCPKCSQAHSLTTHTIREDGEVVPSVVCGKCDFHDYVTLEECAPEAVNYDESPTDPHHGGKIWNQS